MSWHVLVKPIAIGATLLIAADAAERGYRRGRERGDVKMGEFDANLTMSSGMQTSDSFLIDGLGNTVKDSLAYQNGFLSSTTRFFHGITGVGKELVKSALPLGIAAASIFCGPYIGLVGLGVLGAWGVSRVMNASGLTKNTSAEFLDIKM